MHIQHFAAFSRDGQGGNPAGVVLLDQFPGDEVMQRTAADLGYSETVFAAQQGSPWRVRYFAPTSEVPFCGHATIALGAALAEAHGNGTYPLVLHDGTPIVVEGLVQDGSLSATLRSPSTRSQPLDAQTTARVLAVFGYHHDDLDPRIPPARIHGGASHLLIALRDAEGLASLQYEFEAGRQLMLEHGVATVGLVHAETAQRFLARHAFAGGGVYEDPATGAGAAALAGYLRDIGWPHGGTLEILQGQHMGVPCRIAVRMNARPGEGVQVSGEVRRLVAGKLA
jgi:PhzF family phenazine biosynthesis protein